MYRATGIIEQTDYGKNIDPQMVQDLGVLKLTSVDKADSSCPAVEYGCTIKKVVLPKLINLPENRSLMFVGLVDKQTPVVIDSADTFIYKSATRFGKIFDRCYLIGNTLYFVTREDDSAIKYINVRGVFEDPTEVSTYAVAGCDARCYDESNDEYPMPIALRDYVVTKIMQKELGFGLQQVQDELNNARQENNNLNP